MTNKTSCCPHCGSPIPTDDLKDFITNSDTYERSQGTEIFNYVECENFVCTSCRRSYNIKGYISEYPSNTFNIELIGTDEY